MIYTMTKQYECIKYAITAHPGALPLGANLLCAWHDEGIHCGIWRGLGATSATL